MVEVLLRVQEALKQEALEQGALKIVRIVHGWFERIFFQLSSGRSSA
jgi:hypothetical protein